MGKGVDHDVDAIAARPLHHLQGSSRRPPASPSDEDEVGDLQRHPGLARDVEHLLESAQVVRLQVADRVGGRDRAQRLEVHGHRLAYLGGHPAEGGELFERRIHPGVVAEAEAQPAGALVEGAPGLLQTASQLLGRHGASGPGGCRGAKAGVTHELGHVDDRPIPVHPIEELPHRAPAEIEGLLHQHRHQGSFGGAEAVGRNRCRREAAVPGHHAGDALLQHDLHLRIVFRERHRPVRVGMHVDETGRYHATPRVEDPIDGRGLFAASQEPGDPIAFDEDISLEGRRPGAVENPSALDQ